MNCDCITGQDALKEPQNNLTLFCKLKTQQDKAFRQLRMALHHHTESESFSLLLSCLLLIRVLFSLSPCGVVVVLLWWVVVSVVCGVSTRTILRVYVQNVPVCTSTTRTHVSTCARGASIHGDVLNVHTETC